MSADGYILVADIGGTNTRLAVTPQDRLDLRHVRVYASKLAVSFEALLSQYLAEEKLSDIRGATLAPAGPIEGDTFKVTNTPWPRTLASEVEKVLGGAKVLLINDFEAVAYSVPHIPAAELVPIGGGTAKPGWPIVVVGPGTGLGMAYMVPVPGGTTIIKTAEAGVTSLPMQTEREVAIARHGKPAGTRIYTEALIAGSGLHDIYTAIGALDGKPAPLKSPSQVADAALAGRDPVAVAALDQYLVWFGRVVGDLALALRAEGGIIIGGGIPPKILPRLISGPFRAAFDDKAPLDRLAKGMSIKVITADMPALIGAAAAFAERYPDLLKMA